MLGVAQRSVGFPRQHRLVERAAAEVGAERAHSRKVERKDVVGAVHPEGAVAICDKAVRGNAHRVDQHYPTVVWALAHAHAVITDWTSSERAAACTHQ